MSRNTNNFPQAPLHWGFGQDYEANYNPSSNDSNYMQPWYSTSQSFLVTPDGRGGGHGTLQTNEDRRFQTPLGVTSIPTPSHTPFLIVFDNGVVTEAPYRRRQNVPDPPPRTIDHRDTPIHRRLDSSRSNQIQQQKVLEKLKRTIYNPLQRRFTKRINLYYRDIPVNEKEINGQEEGKRCAICLEDFEPKQEVMLTPCNHIFHEECIVPWVTSNPQCPVCRFGLGDKMRERQSATTNIGFNHATTTEELISIIRAMEGTAFYI
ncbi:uncharacterized protein LOC107417220 isoform X1 [Ziziphus jujuba]|uniref:Uncharacterized protein LOC107417220 isoform X1 n=1 Tax=Ziziphus jujuba TaxID=326968 RepID=A0A6P3ZQ52_ZIZJJ|nr:uncharacterized protein LOC107417220 isoform X1 [Ziziphus jujuba]